MIQEPDFPYFPREAAYQLHVLSCELENYNVAQESISELRQISQRFTRHLNGLESFKDRFQDIARALPC